MRPSVILTQAALCGAASTITLSGVAPGKERVVGFNEDRAQRDTTWLEHVGDVSVPGDYTLCLRFNLRVFRLLTAVIYLLDKENYDNIPISFEVYFEKIRTKYGGYARFYPLPYHLSTYRWYHYCHVRDVGRGEGLVYLDGQLLVRDSFTFPPDAAARTTIVGQDEWMSKYSLSGQLSQVNVWGRVLGAAEVRQVAGCSGALPRGDVLGWDGPWEAHGVQEKDVPVVEFCQGGPRGQLTVPLPLLRYHDAVRVCRGLRGSIAVPTTRQAFEQEMAFYAKYSEDRWEKPVEDEGNSSQPVDSSSVASSFEGCKRQWTGSNDEREEGVWFNPFTGESQNSSELYFQDLNPDGGQYQNCALVRASALGLLDTDCRKPSCSACHTPAGATWTLRGICEEEERMYYFDVVARPLSFQGYGEYVVTSVGGTWTWYNTITNATLAVLPPTPPPHYPIGRLTWTLKSEVCGQETGERELTLSPCRPGEFTCTDGSCVSFSRRCDLKFDCEDKTDESFCEIINFPVDYRMNLPPRPKSDEPLPVGVNLTVDTLNIDTATMLLSVSYNLRLTWRDNRLTFNNLKTLTRLNTVSMEQVEQLWRPKIGFINTDDIENTAVDQDAVTTIVKLDASFATDRSNAYEVEIYRGESNPVSTTRKYSTVFTCNFDLTLYPFDIQTCYLHLRILTASSEYLLFSAADSEVRYLGERLLVEYGIGDIGVDVPQASQYSEMWVRVELIRRYGYAMLNIYIPSLTLLTISYVTLFFRPSIFEVRVMTALTALLVLATLFTQVSASLPKTSYFKMVDIWLLFCILLIFFIIICHTVIDLQIDYGDTSSQKWAKRSSGVSEVLVRSPGGAVPVVPVSLLGRLSRLDLDFRASILLSKCIVFSVFMIFNFIYWGTLARDSGLVYYY